MVSQTSPNQSISYPCTVWKHPRKMTSEKGETKTTKAFQPNLRPYSKSKLSKASKTRKEQQISHQKCMTRFVTTMKPNERVLCMFRNSGRLMRELSVYQTHPSSVSLPIRHWLRVRSRIRHLVLEMYWLRLHTAFCSVTGNDSMIIADFLFRLRFF